MRYGNRRARFWGCGRLEDVADSVFHVNKEVIDKALDVVLSEGFRQSTKANSKQPDVQIRHGEPGLERWR